MDSPRTSMSVRAKAILLTLVVLLLALSAMATTSVVQADRFLTSAQRHEAEALAKSMAAACELPLSVLDRTELDRLMLRFVAHDHVVFVAVLDESGDVRASATNEQGTWRRFLDREVDDTLLGRADVEQPVGIVDVFDVASSPQPPKIGKRIGQAVVGMSNEPTVASRQRQILGTLGVLAVAATPVDSIPC